MPEFDGYSAGSGWGAEVGYQQSPDDHDFDDVDFEVEMRELYVGVRKTFGDEDVHPWIGAGLSYVHGDFDFGSDSDDDTDLAPYIHVGVGFDVEEKARLGLDWRLLFGRFDLAGGDVDADYGQFLITLSIEF